MEKPVVCFARKTGLKRVNNAYKRCLRLIYSGKRSSYEELLEKDGLVSFHHRNIQVLATELYKIKNDVQPNIFSNLFCQKEMNSCNLRIQHDLEVPFVKTQYNWSKSISYIVPKTWDVLPASIREVNLLNNF